jgi:signal transduction histidine kinase
VRRFSRLALRIYLVSLLQLLAIVAAVIVVGYLTFASEHGPDFAHRGHYVLDTVVEQLGDPDALQRELTRAERQMHVSMSLFRADGTLLASNVTPPLTAADVRARSPRPPHPPIELLLHLPPGGPPTLRLPIHSSLLPGGYALYRPQPPPGRESGLWTLVIALLATGIASVLLARSFARPLSQLSAAAKRFGGGDLAARAGLTRRDEFGDLSRSFDEMAERVMQLVRSRQELLANVSHELRTPLARIRVALDLAGDDQAANPDLAREVLGEIAEDWAELERLVTDVLQTARLDLAGDRARVAQQPLRLESFPLSRLLDRAAERFRGEHPRRSLELDCERQLPDLRGDFMLLRRVLDNLLDNASKYSPEESPVVLRAKSDGARVALCVEDCGIGISAGDLPQIGSPFFRADRSRTRRTGGLGLGLSLARNIVEAHGGTLRVESELDRGTRVHVVLPLDETPRTLR